MTQTMHNEDAERALIGSVFLDNSKMTGLEGLEAITFYKPSHRHVWRACLELHKRGTVIDVITVADHLNAAGLLDAVGGPNYLAKLSSHVPSSANYEYYRTIIERHASLRELKALGRWLEDAASNVTDYSEFLDDAQSKVVTALTAGRASTYVTSRAAMKEGFAEIEAEYKSGDVEPKLPTGFADLDEITGGWQPGDLVIVAGRPAMGKTSWVMQAMYHLAIDREVPVAVFTLEMKASTLAKRAMCSEARISMTKLRSRRMTDQEWAKLIKAAGKVGDAPLIYDETPALKIAEFRQRARQLVFEYGVQVIAVDYLQLMKCSGPTIGSREQEISAIARGLKQTAKELKVPIVALAQLNRGVESRADKRPMNSDLRESGAIEQDADIISFIYRDEVYNPESEHKGIAEFILGKHRNGGLGTVRLRFFGEYTRFESLEKNNEPNAPMASGHAASYGYTPEMD